MADDSLYFHIFVVSNVFALKLFNEVVDEPYMDEPFHIPQAQAYCRGEFDVWDPKITTPPGLYLLSTFLKTIFMLKCNLAVLRLTPLLALMALPVALSRLLSFHQRRRDAPWSTPFPEAVVLSMFPIGWFFGFLYYTEVPSLLSVVATIAAAGKQKHWLAALLGLISCSFRQTNIIWVLYAYAASQLMHVRFRNAAGSTEDSTEDPPPLALEANATDLLLEVKRVAKAVPDLLPSFLPYSLVLSAFIGFVLWNGGIVLGDKSNHVPAVHIPQLYYFFGFSTIMGWPALVMGAGGVRGLIGDVCERMFGSKQRGFITGANALLMAGTVYLFTIHHPFLLSDNRHYTFYVWRRVFMLHPIVPYLLIPGYIACAWAWFLRVARDQTLLQTMILPLCLMPTLVPTPLLEPRYFLIPYVLMRAQVVDVSVAGLFLEAGWYHLINAATMVVFLYMERPGVGRFMW